MKVSNLRKKMILGKETIFNFNHQDQVTIRGGEVPPSAFTDCYTCAGCYIILPLLPVQSPAPS